MSKSLRALLPFGLVMSLAACAPPPPPPEPQMQPPPAKKLDAKTQLETGRTN